MVSFLQRNARSSHARIYYIRKGAPFPAGGERADSEMNQNIESFTNGMHVEGFYLLKDGSVKITNSGKPFLNGTLADRTGTIEFKFWEYAGPVTSDDIGKIIKIRGEVNDYRGSLQVIVNRIRVAVPTDPYDVSELVPTAPIEANEALMQVRELISRMTDGDYRTVCETMLDRHLSAFRRIPAAKSVHHSFVNGLLMHTSFMMRAAEFYASMYPDLLQRDLLIAGTFLHDLAKREEFLFSDLGIVTDYSKKGQLLGHLVMGSEDIGNVGRECGIPEEKILLLQHMILSHHGTPEFGAAKPPMIAEAELLYHLDLIDSRMEIYREEYEGMAPDSFSDKNVYPLDKKIYKHS